MFCVFLFSFSVFIFLDLLVFIGLYSILKSNKLGKKIGNFFIFKLFFIIQFIINSLKIVYLVVFNLNILCEKIESGILGIISVLIKFLVLLILLT